MGNVSRFRLYLLRALYLFVVAGLATYVWPSVVSPGTHWGTNEGMLTCMLAAFSILCLIGLRYPLMILPVLIWEIVWKTLWLILVPLPQWLHGHVDEQLKPTIFAVSLVVLVYLAIPWRYTFTRFITATGDRWQ